MHLPKNKPRRWHQDKINYESDGLSKSLIKNVCMSALVVIGTILLELEYRAAPE